MIIKFRDPGDGPVEKIIYDYRSSIVNFNIYKGKELSSISTGHETIEELKEYCEVPDYGCKVCGGVISTKYYEPTKSRLLENTICFSCDFWERTFNEIEKGDRLVIDGDVYSVGPKDDSPKKFKGHGGHKFVIEVLSTGEIIETDNLWSNGTIPSRYEVENTAKFIKR